MDGRYSGPPRMGAASSHPPAVTAVDVRENGVFPLKNMHHTKGLEFVCNLKLTGWPVEKLQG
jgi:hypothetical protein